MKSSAADAPPLLRVRELKKHFPLGTSWWSQGSKKIYAVDGVSLELEAGKTLGLVGESGCGKSTLGRTILRAYEPTAGTIWFNGVDISRLKNNALRPLRRDLQIIFQDPYSSLNPKMTVEQILSEPFIIHRSGAAHERSARVAALLDTVGLSAGVKNRYPHEFSGGQKQRIGIARAIALQPKLIIADEPVSALDVSIRSQIINLLKDLQDELGIAYLFISHDLAVIEHISDFVAVMYLGRIVEHTSRAALYQNPQHPYTKALIAAIPLAEVPRPGARRTPRPILSGDVPSPAQPPQGCHFHPRCLKATAICREKAPILRDYGNLGLKHLVACHHVGT